jgi:DNA-binding NarL/FixJ family response regulator
VDDHRFFVAGLTSLINQTPNLEVCGVSHDGTQVLRDLRRLHPDLVILDVQLSRTDGLTIAAALRRMAVDLPLLFLSSLANGTIRRKALQLGACAFLEKTQEPERILDGIQRALTG